MTFGDGDPLHPPAPGPIKACLGGVADRGSAGSTKVNYMSRQFRHQQCVCVHVTCSDVCGTHHKGLGRGKRGSAVLLPCHSVGLKLAHDVKVQHNDRAP